MNSKKIRNFTREDVLKVKRSEFYELRSDECHKRVMELFPEVRRSCEELDRSFASGEVEPDLTEFYALPIFVRVVVWYELTRRAPRNEEFVKFFHRYLVENILEIFGIK